MKVINLALQGGGAHGAFTWGVLETFLAQEDIEIEGISATSAGALNAVVLAHGIARGGRVAAVQDLEAFWRNISTMGDLFSPMRMTRLQRLMGDYNIGRNLGFRAFEWLIKSFSPYELNPTNENPLRHVLRHSVDMDEIKKCACIKLFISATSVRTGKVRVFKNMEITEDVIIASATLPYLFQAVNIEGENYWDGGYMGNPALHPLFYHTDSCDIVVVHINPLVRNDLPRSSEEIQNRINEITFNSSLLKEFRAIAFVQKLLDEDMLRDEHRDKLRYIFMHSIRADEVLCDLNVSSKFNTNWRFLNELRTRGQLAAEAWLSENKKHLGQRSTVDLRAEFLEK